MKKFRIWLMLVVYVILGASAVYAGTAYRLSCNNLTCNFQEDVGFGGGFTFMKLTGYCVECEHFVKISWRNDERPAEPMGYVWDEFRGEKRPVYGCPKCGKPFLPIDRPEHIKHCPKCGKDSLSIIWMMYYD
jgi:Zn finger protein HypA/HybF involved in hydrogenase expression